MRDDIHCFRYVETDISVGMTLTEYRRRTCPVPRGPIARFVGLLRRPRASSAAIS